MSVAVDTYVFPADIPSSVSEEECERLYELARGETVLELGSWQGRSTVAMAQSAERVQSIDWHRGDPNAGEMSTLHTYFANLERYGVQDKVISYVGRFRDVLPLFRKRSFTFAFVDGYHSAAAVAHQIVWARHLVAEGGLIAFHDYGTAYSGCGGEPFAVTEMVDTHFPNQQIEIVDSLAIVRND